MTVRSLQSHKSRMPDNMRCMQFSAGTAASNLPARRVGVQQWPSKAKGGVVRGTEASAAGEKFTTSDLIPLRRHLWNNISLNHAVCGELDSHSVTMAPLVHVFSAENLPDHVNTIQRNFQEKRRKGPAVNLKECQLLEMVQYSCNPPQEEVPQPGVITCEPLVRLFRR